MKLQFKLNNNDVRIEANGVKRLLDIIRDDLNITGPKEGCGEGECGACSVIMDGKLVNSCLIPAASAQGSNIITVEGLRETDEYKILDECFKEAGAVQCGFCIPGMIMASYALLCSNKNPDERAIREAISGNICRCTGYNMIIDAVKMAAKRRNTVWNA